jgi:hypothetical protein
MRWTGPAELSSLVAAATLLACAGPPRSSPLTQPAPAASSDRLALADAASDLITAALQADARLDRADSLYAASAISIADGHYRAEPPRFAGLAGGGSLAVGSMQVVVRDSLVWAVVEYRWFSPSNDLARQALATILLAPPHDTIGWKIVHTHSSTAR